MASTSTAFEKHASSSSSSKRVKLAHAAASVNYREGLFLAPMVRCGSLPTRLLSLDYGASLVWGPETIDRAIIGTERTVDETTGTINYMKKGKSLWETHPIEKNRLIYQIGSADPDLALQAAKIVQQDVAGVDLNCGCPKDFSLKGGMGAALLKTPDKLCAILRNLVANLDVPVSAKIRLLPEQEPTLALVKQIASTGISCLTVHCRTQTMRDREPALLHRLKEIVETVRDFGIPVVANGDCWGAKDKERICGLTGVTSIMIARGAEANPSCFSPSGLQDPIDVILPRYTQIAMLTNNHFQNTKYCIYAMDLAATSKEPVPGIKATRLKLKQDMSHLKTYEALCKLLNLDYEAYNNVKDINEVLPGLKEKLARQDRVIEAVENGEEASKQTFVQSNEGTSGLHEEEEEELKRKVPTHSVIDVAEGLNMNLQDTCKDSPASEAISASSSQKENDDPTKPSTDVKYQE